MRTAAIDGRPYHGGFHMDKKKLLFWGLLLSGVALCLGGIVVHLLLIPGGSLIAAAGALHAVMPDRSESHSPVLEEIEEIVEHAQEQGQAIDIDLTLHLGVKDDMPMFSYEDSISPLSPLSLESEEDDQELFDNDFHTFKL